MDNENLKQLYNAIKTDDLLTFKNLVKTQSELSICFGRFPILSLCYLFGSYRIVDNYEDELLQIKKYDVKDEYFDTYLHFKKYAKKSIRLYLKNQIVSPLEMLAIIDDRKKIAKLVNKYENNDEICAKIKKIYSLSHKTDVEIDKEKFIAPKKPLSKTNKIYVIVATLFMSVMLIFCSLSVVLVSVKNGLGSVKSPIEIKNEKEFVTALKNGKRNYILTNDITLSSSKLVEKFSGTIDGNGKKLYLNDNFNTSLIKNFSGIIKNLSVEILNEKIEITNNLAIFAEISTGKIENCEISGYVSGTFNNLDDAYLSMFVYQNDGEINNSKLSVSVDMKNSTEKNAFYSGFSSINNGQIKNCKVTDSLIKTDTVDIASIAITNNGVISECENDVDLIQESSKLWHPNTSGICIDNNGTIQNVINNGNISSSSTNEVKSNESNDMFVIYAVGIAVNNNGTITGVTNQGKIFAKSIVAQTYSSGIVVNNNKEINGATNNGEIYASSDSLSVYASGIVCYNAFTYKIFTNDYGNQVFDFVNTSSVYDSVNNSKISAITNGEYSEDTDEGKVTAYVGGICATNLTIISGCNNNGDIVCEANNANINAGGIVGFIAYYSSFTKYLPSFLISNSISKSTITVSSVTGTSYVGGVVGYNVGSTVEKSGFEGVISNNAVKGFSGGLIGSCEIASIQKCYSYVKFNSESSSTIYNASLVGYYYTRDYIYSANNAFVKNGSIPAMYLKDNTVEDGYLSYDADKSGAKEFDSLEQVLNYINSEAQNENS